MAIRKSKELSDGLGDPELVSIGRRPTSNVGTSFLTSSWCIAQGGTALHSSKYHLLPMDLRLPPPHTLESGLGQSNLLDPSLPTLLVFECVLAYMSPAASSQLIRWFVDFSAKSEQGVLGCLIYEMFGLNDAFGRVMINNLRVYDKFWHCVFSYSYFKQERNIQLPGAEPFTTIDSVQRRFLDIGFSGARALTLKDIRRDYISKEELERYGHIHFTLLLLSYGLSTGYQSWNS
jgi:[phosphatase 2A protein]-leucine-carboxy methyltransferase